MSTVSSLFLYVIVIVIVIALLLLAVWLLNEIARNKYSGNAVKSMLLPGQVPLSLADWEPITSVDGVFTCNGTAPLEGLSERVQLSVKSKNELAINNFTKSVKFQFNPIYKPLPIDIIQQLLKFFGISSSLMAEVKISDGEAGSSFIHDSFLTEQDVLLEFGMQAVDNSEAKKKLVAEPGYFAVAFNIDPTITRVHEINKCDQNCPSNCNQKNWYCSEVKNIRVTVSASVGSVNSTPGSIVKTGKSVTVSINNPKKEKKYLSVGGRAKNDNTYSLTGTWNN